MLLAAAAGAAGMTAARALGAPIEVRAGSDGDVVLGGTNISGASTTILNHSTNVDVLSIDTWGSGRGIYASSSGGRGIHGSSNAAEGIYGWGVTTGVTGECNRADGYGVVGVSSATDGGAGVGGFAQATVAESAGVLGQASSPEGFGVLGDTLATEASARAIVGHAPAGTAVLGWAGTGAHPSGLPETGVFGYSAIDSESVGVRGESPAGTGVKAVSSSGNALRVAGKARFNRSGRSSVKKGQRSVDVTVPGGISSNTVVHATIQRYRSGVAVAGVRLNYPAPGKVRIYLTKVASSTSSTAVGWIATEFGS
jgi:hypothetical protein